MSEKVSEKMTSKGMQVEPLVVTEYSENTYLVWQESTMQGFVLDPGGEAPRILAAIERIGFTPQAILLTHAHSDHIGAVGAIKERHDVPIYLGSGEEEMLADPQKNLSAAFGGNVTSPPADHLLVDGDKITVAGFEFTAISAPGHSPASICYLCDRIMFCGDVVFMGSIGRTDLPGGDTQTLMNSIRDKILPLPDDVFLYPGHGPATTVGRERIANPFLTALSAGKSWPV